MWSRLILADWTEGRKVLEGEFTYAELKKFNEKGYNVYYLPNSPSSIPDNSTVHGSHIDTFTWIFCDCDLKDKKYASKDEFIETIAISGIKPTKIIDSGHGIHCYWKIKGLDAKSYLRFQRRLIRLFNTDEAVGQIFQLMRVPGYFNTKDQNNQILCQILYESDIEYTCEDMDKLLPPITLQDEEYCIQHYNKTYNLLDEPLINDELPAKFGQILQANKEIKKLWAEPANDRSKADYRLAHLLYANGFTRDEALSTLVNTAKALQRAPIHRQSYARGIVDKIWTYEKSNLESDTVRDILSRGNDNLKGMRFPCHKILDDTVHGFRLGHVLGIIGGSGVGKTTLTLNCFLWFAEANPDYHHFFFSLEQPAGEIAERIKTICQGNDRLYDRIHIISNYNQDGSFKNFSIDMVEEHLLNFKNTTKLAVGAAVIDHIGVLSKSDKNGEYEGLMGICRKMKEVAVKVNCMLIMLSQAPREKAGIGDLELNKDAAFGTSYFENFVDWLLCLWQPLKRVYSEGAPTLMAFKYAKIRHKKQGKDRIQEDTRYQLYFDPNTERLRELTQDEEKSAKFFMNLAANDRKKDRKVDIVPYESRRVENNAKSDSH